MKTLLAVTLALAIAPSAWAQTAPPGASPTPQPAQPVATAAAIDVPDAAQAAVAVVEAFGDALVAGDFEQVEAMLDPAVIILETGGVENSREEYLGHHARSDAKFLAGTSKTLKQRRARIDGNTAWVASESELHASKDGQPMTLLSTETMVLNNTPAGWKIVHIHWSSRPKKS